MAPLAIINYYGSVIILAGYKILLLCKVKCELYSFVATIKINPVTVLKKKIESHAPLITNNINNCETDF